MYAKLSDSYNKRRIYNYEDEPPEKKLISDGDIFIKQLAEKQRNTKTNLKEQLALKQQFCKSTELISLTNHASGSSSLEEFNFLLKHLNNVEQLKSRGLTDDEIQLLQSYDKEKGTFGEKYRNINEAVLKERLEDIFKKLDQHNKEETKVASKPLDRLKTEIILSTKPNSIETKLLKFAFENKQKCVQLPSFMDQIKEVEKQLEDNISPINIKKIRKKARQLGKQIEQGKTPIKEPLVKTKPVLYTGNTRWDVKETGDDSKLRNQPKEIKNYTCKQQNFYTIKDGQIVQINPPQEHTVETKKLSFEEIRAMPKFQNYEKGTPSKVLYLKNVANSVKENDLGKLFCDYLDKITSIKMMTGRMQGQVFVDIEDDKTAEKILDQFNGVVLKNRPIIIQFGKKRHFTPDTMLRIGQVVSFTLERSFTEKSCY